MPLDLKTVVIIGIIIVAVVVFAFVIKDNIAKKQVLEKIKEYFGDCIITKAKAANTFRVETSKGVFYFAYIVVPSNSCIAINYQYTWQLFFGGSKENKGRAYPKTRFLEEIVEFCKMQAEEDAKKICVVHRETEHIDMYINENEMVEVDVCVKKYGYSLVQYNHFEEDMQKVLDNK